MTISERGTTLTVPPFKAMLVQTKSKRKRVFYTFDGKTRPRDEMGLRMPASPNLAYIVDNHPTKPHPIYVKLVSVSGPAVVNFIIAPRVEK